MKTHCSGCVKKVMRVQVNYMPLYLYKTNEQGKSNKQKWNIKNL